jgi:hypothetical protein
VDIAQLQRTLDDVYDHALIHHGFTPYMRDYELIVSVTADPVTGIPPAYLRYLFRFCVEATTRSTLTRETWQRSQDERLIDYETGVDLDAFVWGVDWQPLDPGFSIVPDSARAQMWSATLGTDFHEVHMESNAHDLTLVFADLTVAEVDVGYAPFVITDDEP